MGFEKEKKSVPRSERKAKKRKAEDAIPDVPEDYAEEPEQDQEVKKSKKRKHTEDGEEKKSKKEKKEKKTEVEADVEMKEAEGDEKPEGEDSPRKSKKERKAERKAKEAAERAANPPVEGAPIEDRSTTKEDSDKKSDSKDAAPAAGTKPVRLDADGNPIKKKNNRNREKKRLAAAALAASGEKAPPRFIVFVGNLPFSATKEKIEKHFASVHPKSVRHLTDKATGKSRGTAFVEFEGYDHMKTALRTMHHTLFEDGTKEGRRINVELT